MKMDPSPEDAAAECARNTIEKMIRNHAVDEDSDQLKRHCKALADTIAGLSVDELLGRWPV